MERDKQIEEMMQLMCDDFGETCKECPFRVYPPCQAEAHAKALVAAGYRKQVEGEWEQFGLQNPKCSLCRGYNTEKSNFCPNCGAKMKGK